MKNQGYSDTEIQNLIENIYTQINENVQGVNSESYLWYISSYAVENASISEDGSALELSVMDWIPFLGTAANLPYVKEFHPQRLRSILNQINATLGTELRLLVQQKKENEGLYRMLKSLYKAETHSHITMALPFETYTWNGVILEYDDARAEDDADYRKAYEDGVSKSEEMLKKVDAGRGLPIKEIGLRDKFKRARELTRELYGFITAYDKNYTEKKNKDYYAKKAQAFLELAGIGRRMGLAEKTEITKGEINKIIAMLSAEQKIFVEGLSAEKIRALIIDLTAKERQKIANKIELYFRIKYYIFNRFNYQEGSLKLFVNHFMAVSKIHKISADDELLTLKRIVRECLLAYQEDGVKEPEVRFNIDGKDIAKGELGAKNTLRELLAVISACKEFEAEQKKSNPDAFIPKLFITLSITKFNDPENPAVERTKHKNDSFEVLRSIYEAAEKMGQTPFASIKNEAGKVVIDLSGDLTVTGNDILERLVGMDAAGQEESNPPYLYYEAYRRAKQWSKLGLTFHVGESLEDVSLEDAIRHCLEAAFMKDFTAGEKMPAESILARLGHAIILGVDFDKVRGIGKNTTLDERIRQIKFDLWLLEQKVPLISVTKEGLERELNYLEFLELKAKGKLTPEEGTRVTQLQDYVEKNQEQLKYIIFSEDGREVVIKYDSDEKIRDLKTRAGFVRDILIEKGVVIESNPTSNIGVSPYIWGYEDHTLKIFLSYRYGDWARDLLAEEELLSPAARKNLTERIAALSKQFKGKRLRVTVNTDDLTLFGTSVTEEIYRVAVAQGLSWEEIAAMNDEGFASRMKADQRSAEEQSVITEQLNAVKRARDAQKRLNEILTQRGELKSAGTLKRYVEDPLLELAHALVLKIITDPEGRRRLITYHDEWHFNELFDFSDPVLQKMFNLFGNFERAKSLIRLAIYFHDAGYFTRAYGPIAQGHEDEGKQILKNFQARLGLSNREIEAVSYMIDMTKFRLHGAPGADGKIINLEREIKNDNLAYRLLRRLNQDGVVRRKRFLSNYLGQRFGMQTEKIESLLNPQMPKAERELIMMAILGGKAIACADVFGSASNYPFLVALLQPEFIYDKENYGLGAPQPTRFEQVQKTPGFIDFVAMDMRIKFMLGIDSKGNKIPGFDDESALFHYIPEELWQKRAENKIFMVKIGKAIDELKEDGIDINAEGQKNREILEQFVKEGVKRGLFNADVAADLFKEIKNFAIEGKIKLLKQVGMDKYFSQDDLEYIALEMVTEKARTATKVLRGEGLLTDAFMVISGQADIFERIPQNKIEPYKMVGLVNKGEFFGNVEGFGFAGEGFSASARKETILAKFSPKTFHVLLRNKEFSASLQKAHRNQLQRQTSLVAQPMRRPEKPFIEEINFKEPQTSRNKTKLATALKDLGLDDEVKEIYIAREGALLEAWRDPQDGKVVLFISYLLIADAKIWKQNFSTLLNYEIAMLDAAEENYGDENVALLKTGVDLARQAYRYWANGEIDRINNNLELLLEKIDDARKNEPIKADIQELIDFNKNIIREGGFTEGVLEYLMLNILKNNGRIFTERLRTAIERELAIEVVPSGIAYIRTFADKIVGQTKISEGDYEDIKEVILKPLIDVFRAENMWEQMNEDTWKAFQQYKGNKVEFSEDKVKTVTLALLIATDRIHQKAGVLFIENLQMKGRLGILLKLAAETHNAYYRGEVQRMLEGKNVLVAELDFLSSDEIEQFLVTGKDAEGNLTLGEQFKIRRDNPQWKGKLTLKA
ncbi:MAG: hypothetical protein KJ710_06685, partial [Candidatus Omnitrophica bacterium]|nr:hypothetical protein [Candidatus Omnitrophota bacterium]